MLIYPVIFYALTDSGFRAVMRCRWKVFRYVALQNPALISVLIEIASQMYAHALVGKCYALPNLTRAVIMDEAFRYRFIQVIVAQASLKLSVPDSCRDYLAVFGFADVEHIILLNPVRSVEQVFSEFVRVLDRI